MPFLKSLTSVLTTVIFGCFSFSVLGQGNYVHISAGANFAQLSDNSGMGHAKGFTPGIAIGRMFNDQFGAELGLVYLWGAKNMEKSSFQEFSGSLNHYITMNTETTKYSRMLWLQPALVLTDANPGNKLYFKLGPVIGLGKMYEIYKEDGDGSPLERHLEFSGGSALGGQTAVGVNFGKAKTVFFAEANLKLAWYSPTNGEVIKLLLSGKNRTADMSVKGREVVYVNHPVNSYGDYNSPTQADKQKHPFHSVGLNIGIKHTF